MKRGLPIRKAARLAIALLPALAMNGHAMAQTCKGTLYLTFDTGSQSQAQFIADTLQKHAIKATFFLASEKTVNGDRSLDPAWAPYWKRLVAQGHVFGSHTFDHVYVSGAAAGGKIRVKPQFGQHSGQTLEWTPQQFCSELKRVDERFSQLTGQRLAPIWRAPGGRANPQALAAAKSCGYTHVGWAETGFLGDELSSTQFPNDMLLKRALENLRDGDIAVAHLGIWSRKDPWAPAVLEPLIVGLKSRGFCFATLKDHPQYGQLWK
jgi:peptidoglycan/xylan/chitin deacetylase (PgdA/CDA1 family)